MGRLQADGEADVARAKLKEAIAELQRVLREGASGAVAEALYSLGYKAYELGLPRAAADAWAAGLAHRERCLPEGHPRRMGALSNTAAALGWVGEYRRSYLLLGEALRIREKTPRCGRRRPAGHAHQPRRSREAAR